MHDVVLLHTTPTGSSLLCAPLATVAPPTPPCHLGRSPHVVQFYESESYLLQAVATFIGESLGASGAGIVIATAEHRAGIAMRLAERGFDLNALGSEGRYLALDAAETAAAVMRGATIDAARFAEIVGKQIDQAAGNGRVVHVFGEMVALLVANEEFTAALRLEVLWNAHQEECAFSLLCGYSMEELNSARRANILGKVCRAHSQIILARSDAELPNDVDRWQEIVALQQKSASLEAEMAERIATEERLHAVLASEQACRRAATDEARSRRDAQLALTAHALRNPLTGVALNAQAALRQLGGERPLDPDRVEQSLQAIVGEAARIARLLDHLVDGSHVEDGTLALERQETDLSRLMRDVVARARSRSRAVQIALDVPPSLPAWIDPRRIDQVLSHLLDSALGRSPSGTRIQITLSAADPAIAEVSMQFPGEMPFFASTPGYQAAHAEPMPHGVMVDLDWAAQISGAIVALHGGQMQSEAAAKGGIQVVIRLPVAAQVQMTALANP